MEFPALAREAVGWDPALITGGSNKRMPWRCSRPGCGHEWTAAVYSRAIGNRGCPACANRTLVAGVNDLATRYPEVAATAHGWDPTTVMPGTREAREWLCQGCRHVYVMPVNKRTTGRQNCPACAGKVVIPGMNDLASRFPAIAAQAHGWDPTTVTYGSDKSVEWRCSLDRCGHIWTASIAIRTRQGTGCPAWAGRVVLPGVNDLATVDPRLAAQAHGWDPSEVYASTERRLEWACPEATCGHVWRTSARHRSEGQGCPRCAIVRPGVNDLASLRPNLVDECDGWDPAHVSFMSQQRLAWLCSGCGHRWTAAVFNRSLGHGCPRCAKYGFDPAAPGYLYLVSRETSSGTQRKIGITNYPDQRLSTHAREGWAVLDIRGPYSGSLAKSVEDSIKRRLDELGVGRGKAAHVRPFDGYTESWYARPADPVDLPSLLTSLSLEGLPDITQPAEG